MREYEEPEENLIQAQAFWGRAASLSERLPLLAPLPAQSPEQEIRAQRRLGRWRESFGPEDTTYRQWQEQVALKDEDILQLLGESEPSLHERLTCPEWFVRWQEIWQEPGEPLSDASLLSLLELTDLPSGHIDTRLLLTIVEPFLRHAGTHLSQKLQSLQATLSFPFFVSSSIVQSLLSPLALHLLQMVSRALILEFRVAQQKGQIFVGETAQAQLDTYAQTLRQEDLRLAFFAEYPVLAHQVVLTIDQWISSSEEMLGRLLHDWPLIQEQFWPEPSPDKLVSARSGVGDRHRGGRSVHVLTFASGMRLVYKPRDLSIDVHFQNLLRWVNAHAQTPTMRILHFLPREEYGWMEWVEVTQDGCHETADIERFYLRQGVNLALLYMLEATDLHLENILAVGEDPVLIDLEMLFQVHLPLAHAGLNAAEQRAHESAVTSVLRTLLLPAQVHMGASDTLVEISGLSGAAGQIIPNQRFHLSDQNRNELRFVRTDALTSGAQNRPRLHGEEVDPRPYLPYLLSGFEKTYRLFMAHRDALLSAQGPLAPFRTATTRVIFRATSTYGQLLFACTHPNVLRDELDRERLLAQLWRVVPDQPYLVTLLPGEIEDLQQGNIPYFTTRVDSRDLWNSKDERLLDFFPDTGFTLAQNLWKRLSEQDLARQSWFIRASFTALANDDYSPSSTLSAYSVENAGELPEQIVTREELLDAACQIGDRLCQLAVCEGEKATWLGLEQPDGQHWMLTVADLSLYNGLTGIILMLSYLGHVTGLARYTDLAKAGYATLEQRMEQSQDTWKSVGLFSGWGGIIALLSHLATLWPEEKLLAEAQRIVAFLPSLIAQDRIFDIIGGSAGCCAGLRCLAALAPSSQITETLRLCGEHLAAHALPAPQGIGWAEKRELPLLTGMAHGNAGIAWALLQIAQATRDARFHDLAREALKYERSQFVPEQKNWLDLRPIATEPEKTCRIAWCHGAVGIGLARLQMIQTLDDTLLQEEFLAACETTLAKGFGSNHSLCHGDLGNLELLYQAHQALPDPRWRVAYEWHKATTFARGQRLGWQCGTPQQVETPGLMLGLSGIGLQLLRLAEPDLVPSLLSLDVPLQNA